MTLSTCPLDDQEGNNLTRNPFSVLATASFIHSHTEKKCYTMSRTKNVHGSLGDVGGHEDLHVSEHGASTTVRDFPAESTFFVNVAPHPGIKNHPKNVSNAAKPHKNDTDCGLDGTPCHCGATARQTSCGGHIQYRNMLFINPANNKQFKFCWTYIIYSYLFINKNPANVFEKPLLG